MKHFFFIILLAAILFGTAACTRRKAPRAPNYDNAHLDGIFRVVETASEAPAADTMEFLESLVRQYPDSPFFHVAYRHTQKRLLVSQANALLKTGKYDQLNTLLRDAETHGQTSPELMAFVQFSNALAALHHYNGERLQYTDRVSLTNALDMLERSTRPLTPSAAYKAFMANERQRLAAMEQHVEDQAVQQAVTQLDYSLISGERPVDVDLALRKLAKEKPDNFLKRCRAMQSVPEAHQLAALARADVHAQRAFEVAAWEKIDRFPIDNDLRRELIAAIDSFPQAQTLSGAWCKLSQHSDPALLGAFLQKLAETNGTCVPSEPIVTALLEKQLLPRTHYAAWCWQSPCPGLPEFLARARQFALQHQKP